MSEITIRSGTIDDIPTVHQLVRELAIYENAEHEFVATLEDYQQDFTDGVFSTIVAEDDGQVVGMCLYYLSYSTWKGRMLYLDDFVVKESKRGQGIGQLLYNELLVRAKAWKCRLVKWQVLDWNTPAINFYRQNQAIIENNWLNCKVFT